MHTNTLIFFPHVRVALTFCIFDNVALHHWNSGWSYFTVDNNNLTYTNQTAIFLTNTTLRGS